MKTIFKSFLIFLFLVAASCNDQKKETTSSTPLFKKLTVSETGISFSNKIEENYKNFVDNFNYVYNGGGVAIGDINNDGLADLYFTANDSPNKLYLNTGDFKFKDISQSAGVSGGDGWHNGVVMADVNGDGLLDIYICRGGIKTDNTKERENLLFINQGNTTFKEEAASYGLNDQGYGVHASFFDMDNDNDLDLYITNRPDTFYLSLDKTKENKLNPHDDFRDKLYINTNNSFTEIGKQAGIVNNFGFGLSLVTSDINNDGYIDIYVANDFAENDYLYLNNGNSTFSEKIKEATNHISFYSMGTDIADLNNDGLEDILVTEMLPSDYIRSKTAMPPMNRQKYQNLLDKGFHRQYMHNMLHLNNGNGFFSDISQLAGISKTDWSWSCLMADVDNSGFRDIFISNGYKRDLFDRDSYLKRGDVYEKHKGKYKTLEELSKGVSKEIINSYPSVEISNYMFKNNGDLTFTNQSESWGVDTPSFSNGAAFGDLDNDGDLDLVVNNVDKEAFVYKNNSSKSNNYLRIKLVGPKGNSSGLGTKIKVGYNGQQQYQDFKTVRGYLSSVEPIIHFGIGKESKVDQITIIWQDGHQQILKNVSANQQLTIQYTDALMPIALHETKKTLFTEVTTSYFEAPFRHQENKYDDYSKQVLLPQKYSTNGPFISTGDVNNDGLEDFYIGGASGQTGQLYIQSSNEKFIKSPQKTFENDKDFEDMGSQLFDADGDGDLDLYVVSGGYEFEPKTDNYQDRLYLNNGKGNFKKATGLPQINSSGGCIATADYDNDGDIDIFVGGRVVPNFYPFHPTSYLLENDGKGNFTDNTKKLSTKSSKLGMVTSAVWNDIDADGFVDLILVGEWMPITIFKNDNCTFTNVTENYGLTNTKGWWNKIIPSDLDRDGDMDFIVGNLGLNHKFKASIEKPFHIYANDFDMNGNFDVFLAKYNEKGEQVPVRGLECSSEQMPSIAKRFPTFNKFAKANIQDLLGEGINYGLHYEAQLFQSVYLINENGKFILKPLPNQAQLSTIQGIIASDFDADGQVDILIAGNQFETEIETSRADAAVGLLLKGTNSNSFSPIPTLESGFFVPYNIKDMQTIQLGSAKKTGWLLSANNDFLRLFTSN